MGSVLHLPSACRPVPARPAQSRTCAQSHKNNVLTAVECQVSPPLQQLTIYITGTNLTNSPAIIAGHISGCVIE